MNKIFYLSLLYVTIVTSFCHSTLHKRRKSIKSLLSSNYDNYNPAYLERLVQRKKIEVDTLLRQHQDLDDPLVLYNIIIFTFKILFI